MSMSWVVSWSRYLLNRYTLCATPLAATTSRTTHRDPDGRRHVTLS